MKHYERELRALEALVDRAIAGGDAAPLLGDEARRNALIVRESADFSEDLAAARVLGWYHWLSYEALSDSRGQEDLLAAVSQFRWLYQSDPGSLPELVRHALDEMAAYDACQRAAELYDYYLQTREAGHLERAISFQRRALAVSPSDGDGAIRTNLGIMLQGLYRQTWEPGTLAESVQVQREAIAAVPFNEPGRAMYLANLGISLQLLSDRTGDLVLLAEAVQAFQDAVAATPAGHPDYARHLGDLGAALHRLSERSADVSLSDAVQALRDAVAADAGHHPNRAGLLSLLAAALTQLSDQTGDTVLLAEAVQAGREGAEKAAADHPHRVGILSNLAIALLRTWEREGDAGPLAEAVQRLRDAAAAVPVGHSYRLAILSNLGGALIRLSEETGDADLMAEAVQTMRDAAAAAPPGHASHGVCLNHLAVALKAWAERTDDAQALAEAVQIGRDALAATEPGDPSRAPMLSGLATALQALAARTGATELLIEARDRASEASQDTTAPVFERIRACLLLSELVAGPGSEQVRLQAMETAVGQLEMLAPGSLARADRERRLGQLAGIASRAASAAISACQPERAVELLEQARGILIADTLGARGSDQARLRWAAPDLARQVDELRARLDTPAAVPASELTAMAEQHPGQEATLGAHRHASQIRQAAHAEWQQLLKHIRAIRGFADYLRVPRIGELALQAASGPIAFIITNPARCDALILTGRPGQPVDHVPLTALTMDHVVGNVDRLRAACHAALPGTGIQIREAQETIHDVLAWMWDTITEPVLQALGYTTTPSEHQEWPRIWWSPTGITAYLPLHAAGHHSDHSSGNPTLRAAPRTVLDRVISSYTTTIRSLAYARAHKPSPPLHTLIVAVPDTPGAPLNETAIEACTLASIIPGSLVLPDPTREAVLLALQDHQIAHFACHGHADHTDPARSYLLLSDRPLTIADISARHLPSALAYLSACDTTVTSPVLADESIHIAGAFHLAGYQHIIGTLWPVFDHAAAELAISFYEYLARQGPTALDTSLSPQALHHAIRHLRTRYPDAPAIWAAHIHTGA